MYTTQLDNGVMNAYATEPDMYLATYPSPEQQQQYLRQGAFATLLVSTLLMVALSVS